jgi:hypothetical protein
MFACRACMSASVLGGTVFRPLPPDVPGARVTQPFVGSTIMPVRASSTSRLRARAGIVLAVAMEHVVGDEFTAAVERARVRAERTGELPAAPNRLQVTVVPDELAEFVDRILTDGTYAREVALIGGEDADLASI